MMNEYEGISERLAELYAAFGARKALWDEMESPEARLELEEDMAYILRETGTLDALLPL